MLFRSAHKEIPRYLSIADILVIPHARCTQTELNPTTKVFEYLASGKPIVSSNLKPIRETVQNNAILVEPGSPEDFAKGMIKLLKNEEFGKKIGKNGKILLSQYSWEKTADKLYEGYKSFLT